MCKKANRQRQVETDLSIGICKVQKREQRRYSSAESKRVLQILVPTFYVPLTPWGEDWLSLNCAVVLWKSFQKESSRWELAPGPNGTLFELLLSRCSSTSERPNRIRQMERSIPPAGSTFSSRYSFGFRNTDTLSAERDFLQRVVNAGNSWPN